MTDSRQAQCTDNVRNITVIQKCCELIVLLQYTNKYSNKPSNNRVSSMVRTPTTKQSPPCHTSPSHWIPTVQQTLWMSKLQILVSKLQSQYEINQRSDYQKIFKIILEFY